LRLIFEDQRLLLFFNNLEEVVKKSVGTAHCDDAAGKTDGL